MNNLNQLKDLINGISYVAGTGLAYYIGKEIGTELYYWIWG